MDLQKIEDEALHLSKKERAQLIQRLVLSLMTLRKTNCDQTGCLKRSDAHKSSIAARFRQCRVTRS